MAEKFSDSARCAYAIATGVIGTIAAGTGVPQGRYRRPDGSEGITFQCSFWRNVAK
jgi:hypothetical protein